MTDILYESYVSLETAKLLKKAGFDWVCRFAFLPTTERGETPYAYFHKPTNYNDKIKYPYEVYSAPTLAVAQRWLREEKKIYLHTTGIGPYSAYLDSFAAGGVHLTDWFDSYEEALESGIKKCLTALVNKHESK